MTNLESLEVKSAYKPSMLGYKDFFKAVLCLFSLACTRRWLLKLRHVNKTPVEVMKNTLVPAFDAETSNFSV